MTRDEAAQAKAASAAHQALRDLGEALRVHFAPAFERLSRDLAKAQAEIEAEEHRRRHPRITDNLHKLHRRYRRRP